MPTPFMHLQVAERILKQGSLPPEIAQQVTTDLPAFYLGNIAPDYQTISNIPREQTHFYNLPPSSRDDACAVMLDLYPELKDKRSLSDAHAVFIAAYCCHLLLDLRWYREILVPYFLGPGDWRDYRHRFIVHNTLLTFLDKRAFAALPKTAARTLAQAKPDGWLPFASNHELEKWRDFMVPQMKPGAKLTTVEIYSRRLSMSAEEFTANLEDEEWMEKHVFSRIDLDYVVSLLTSAVTDSIGLINKYFQVPL